MWSINTDKNHHHRWISSVRLKGFQGLQSGSSKVNFLWLPLLQRGVNGPILNTLIPQLKRYREYKYNFAAACHYLETEQEDRVLHTHAASANPYTWTWQLRSFQTSPLISSWETPAGKQQNPLEWIIQHLLKISRGTWASWTCSTKRDVEVTVIMQHWWSTFLLHHGQGCTAAAFQSPTTSRNTLQGNSGLMP